MFLEDGRLELCNNSAERAIRPFIVGRKGWLFCNAPRGAKASATIYSIVETAKEKGLNPYTYLEYLFEAMPTMDIADPQTLERLFPWSKELPARCRSKKQLQTLAPALRRGLFIFGHKLLSCLPESIVMVGVLGPLSVAPLFCEAAQMGPVACND